MNNNILLETVKQIKENNINNTYGMTHGKIGKVLGMTRGQVWHTEDKGLKKIAKYIMDNNLGNELIDYLNFKI